MSRPAPAPAAAAAAPAHARHSLASVVLPSARPELVAQLRTAYRDVCPAADSRAVWEPAASSGPAVLPVAYHAGFNVTLFGLERLHPFDSCKFEKVVAGLVGRNVITSPQQLVAPAAISNAALGQVHTAAYLQQLHTSSRKVAQVTELAPLALLPICVVDRRVLHPMRLHVGGTVLAAALAVARGWAVNLGGGMHHAHREDGGGWCPYADITLAIRRIRAATGGAVQRVLVVDLDAHQGNGVARDKLAGGDADLCIVDMYAAAAYPQDTPAKAGIDVKVELQPGTGDEDYLAQLAHALEAAALVMPRPHLVIFNAGTDVLASDPLGRLAVSPQGVVARDRAVWAFAQRLQAPIAMLLSGGYTRASSGVIVDSLASLLEGVAQQGEAHAEAS